MNDARFEGDREGRESAPAPQPSLVHHVEATLRGPREPPRGRGIAIAVVAAAALVALVLQLTLCAPKPLQPAGHVARARPPGVARPPGEPGEPGGEVPPGEPATTPAPPPVVAPRAPSVEIPVPKGLAERTTWSLRHALDDLDQPRSQADTALRELAAMVLESGESERALLRPFVIARLGATLVDRPRLRSAALDAALAIAGADPSGFGDLAKQARTRCLPDDDAAAAALVLLDALGAPEHAASASALLAVAKDAGRPLHLRVLAARTLSGWGLEAEARRSLAGDAATPAVLRSALTGP